MVAIWKAHVEKALSRDCWVCLTAETSKASFCIHVSKARTFPRFLIPSLRPRPSLTWRQPVCPWPCSSVLSWPWRQRSWKDAVEEEEKRHEYQLFNSSQVIVTQNYSFFPTTFSQPAFPCFNSVLSKAQIHWHSVCWVDALFSVIIDYLWICVAGSG